MTDELILDVMFFLITVPFVLLAGGALWYYVFAATIGVYREVRFKLTGTRD